MNQELLKSVFSYDPDTGTLVHKALDLPGAVAARWNGRNAGKVAGCVGTGGYRRVWLGGKRVFAHRAIWCLTFGFVPTAIDHINGVRDDNRLSNLREVSTVQNNRNACRRKDNSSGVTGVYWHPQKRKWRAQIAVEGRDKHLGYFSSIRQAIAARQEAECRYGFHKNHGRPARAA